MWQKVCPKTFQSLLKHFQLVPHPRLGVYRGSQLITGWWALYNRSDKERHHSSLRLNLGTEDGHDYSPRRWNILVNGNRRGLTWNSTTPTSSPPRAAVQLNNVKRSGLLPHMLLPPSQLGVCSENYTRVFEAPEQERLRINYTQPTCLLIMQR